MVITPASAFHRRQAKPPWAFVLRRDRAVIRLNFALLRGQPEAYPADETRQPIRDGFVGMHGEAGGEFIDEDQQEIWVGNFKSWSTAPVVGVVTWLLLVETALLFHSRRAADQVRANYQSESREADRPDDSVQRASNQSAGWWEIRSRFSSQIATHDDVLFFNVAQFTQPLAKCLMLRWGPGGGQKFQSAEISSAAVPRLWLQQQRVPLQQNLMALRLSSLHTLLVGIYRAASYRVV
jgi:hypothetical protein